MNTVRLHGQETPPYTRILACRKTRSALVPATLATTMPAMAAAERLLLVLLAEAATRGAVVVVGGWMVVVGDGLVVVGHT